MTAELIDKEDAIRKIRHMMDIDGFRAGDAVSRTAVIAILDSMHPTVIGIDRGTSSNTWEDDLK